MIKNFNTLDVLSVYTGRLMNTMDGVYEVMDHFYPGIMTLGIAAMQKTASKEILRQLPQLGSLPTIDGLNFIEEGRKAIEKFGNELALSGPHGTGNPDMMEN
jgi:hypothetical protein